jgi:hypothetical protein
MHCKVLVMAFQALCPRVDGLFAVMIFCLEKTDIIINTISTFCMSILFAFRIIAQSANCSPNLVAEYLAVADNFIDTLFCQNRFKGLILDDFQT